MAKKMTFDTKKAGDPEDIKKKLNNSGGNAKWKNKYWVSKDGEDTIRICANPKDWIEYRYAYLDRDALEEGGFNIRKGSFGEKLPVYEGYTSDFPVAADANVSTQYVVPVLTMNDKGEWNTSVKFWEPNAKILNNLLTLHRKYGDLTDREFEVSREGTGSKTTYTIIPEAPDDSDILDSVEFPDHNEELANKVEEIAEMKSSGGALDDESDDDGAEPEETTEDRLSSVFKVRDLDEDSAIVELVNETDGAAFDSVYLNTVDHDVEEIDVGQLYSMTIVMDDEGDWIAEGDIELVEKKEKPKKKKTSAKKKKTKSKA